jgi:hypothetical protein
LYIDIQRLCGVLLGGGWWMVCRQESWDSDRELYDSWDVGRLDNTTSLLFG